MATVLGNLKKGLIFIVSAPAGTGKTTLVDMLVKEFSNVVASISYTTRPLRSGEVDGQHYHFLTEEEFNERKEKGEFLEHVRLYGYYYGTSKAWIDHQLHLGKHVILVIDTQGAMQLKGKIEAVLIFIAPPTLEALKSRLMSRKTDSLQAIEMRLEQATEEIEKQTAYHYRVVNDDLHVTYQVLRSILIAEEHRVR